MLIIFDTNVPGDGVLAVPRDVACASQTSVEAIVMYPRNA